jgi:hypothetical protein
LLLEEGMNILLDLIVGMIVQTHVVLTVFYDVVEGMRWVRLESLR